MKSQKGCTISPRKCPVPAEEGIRVASTSLGEVKATIKMSWRQAVNLAGALNRIFLSFPDGYNLNVDETNISVQVESGGILGVLGPKMEGSKIRKSPQEEDEEIASIIQSVLKEKRNGFANGKR